MKRKKFIGLMGAIALTLGISSNLQYAFDDYGVTANSLHTEVLAQSSCSSGGGGTTGGNDPGYCLVSGNCEYKGYATPGSTVELPFGFKVIADRNGVWRFTAIDAKVDCLHGGYDTCGYRYCPVLPGTTT